MSIILKNDDSISTDYTIRHYRVNIDMPDKCIWDIQIHKASLTIKIDNCETYQYEYKIIGVSDISDLTLKLVIDVNKVKDFEKFLKEKYKKTETIGYYDGEYFHFPEIEHLFEKKFEKKLITFD